MKTIKIKGIGDIKVKGTKGDKGDSIKGDKGDRGDNGYNGDKGDRGDKGDTLVQIPDKFNILNQPIEELNEISEEIRNIKIPEIAYKPFDYDKTLKVQVYDKKGNVIDKFSSKIEGYRGGGGGYEIVGIKNAKDIRQNPATEDKQDDIIENSKGTMSTNNSTTTPLGIDEVFTGVADDIKDYAAINIAVFADQDSSACGFSIEWSQDGTNWDEKMTVGIGASKVESYEFGVRARYFRVVYTNGGTAQGTFRLQVMYHPVRTREGARCLCVDIDPREFAKTVRSVLAAKKPNGEYENIHSTAGANLKVAVEESEVAFPVGTGSNGSVTLTTAATAYAVPATASTKNHIIILYNGSDTDIFVGFQNTNANGILLPAGGVMNFDLGASQQLFVYCASAGKVLTYSLKELV